MNCDCKQNIEAKLTENFKTNTPESRDHKVELQGYGLCIADNTLKLQPYMTYEGFSYVPLKKGGEKPKKVKGHMLFKFCPFCGEELK